MIITRAYNWVFGTSIYRREYQKNYDNGYVIGVDKNSNWFTTIGKATVDILSDKTAKLRLISRKHGSVAYANIVYYPDSREVFIGDIRSNIENKGYGSVLIRDIVHISREIGAGRITGNLAEVDNGHFNKLEHFYKKHGFEVAVKKRGKRGNISLDL